MATSNSAFPPAPATAHAFMFVDLAHLQCRGREMFGPATLVDPAGIKDLLTSGFAEQGPFGSTLERIYVYDAPPNGPGPNLGDGVPSAVPRPTAVQEALEATDQVHMRYGRMLGGKQKGVDTRLVLDVTKFVHTGVIQVVHAVVYDTDFEELIRHISDLGVQVVLYDFPDAKKALHNDLRKHADRVVPIDRNAASKLFTGPRYRLRGQSGNTASAVDWFARIAGGESWYEARSIQEAQIDVFVGRVKESVSQYRPYVHVEMADEMAPPGKGFSAKISRSESNENYAHQSVAEEQIRLFLREHNPGLDSADEY